jgi:hypothetical protein
LAPVEWLVSGAQFATAPDPLRTSAQRLSWQVWQGAIMEIHKPKPWHGWREFLKEYGIIVLGILTALAAEQAVDGMRIRKEVAETREALQAEISQDATQALIVEAEDKCLLTLDVKFTAWGKGGPRPTFSPPPIYPILQSSAWETSKAGVITHMPLKERLAWAKIYNAVEGLNVTEGVQRQAAFDISTIIYLEKLNATQGDRLVEGAAKLATLDKYQIAASPEFVRLAKSLGAAPAPVPAQTRDTLERFCRQVGGPEPF